MEKYRRFDDPSCGINPFTPLPEQPRPAIMKIAKLLSGILFIIAKTPFVVVLLLILTLVNLAKYLLIVPPLIRLAERIFNYMICKMFLTAFSVNNIGKAYHPEHKDFDFIKSERGELWVNDKIKNGDVILSNNVSFLDYVFLEFQYSPCFTAMAINKETGKIGLRKLGPIQTFFHALGIKFPQEVSSSQFYDDIPKLINSLYVKRSIVIFPEGTKTNGKGILNFEDDLSDIILKAVDQKISVHTIRFDYEYTYHSPYSSTDPLGLKSVFLMMMQVRNIMLIQYYFNVEEKLGEHDKLFTNVSEKDSKKDKIDLIRKTMWRRGQEYILKVTYKEHMQFLDYWFNTQNKFYALKKQQASATTNDQSKKLK